MSVRARKGFGAHQVLRLANGIKWAVGPCGDDVMIAVDLQHVGVVTMLLSASEAYKLGELLDLAALAVEPRKVEVKPMREDEPA